MDDTKEVLLERLLARIQAFNQCIADDEPPHILLPKSDAIQFVLDRLGMTADAEFPPDINDAMRRMESLAGEYTLRRFRNMKPPTNTRQ